MAIKLNHTIVLARDQRASADYLTGILGLPTPDTYGPFTTVQVDNDVTLDFLGTEDEIRQQHYAFLVGEDEFDDIFARVRQQGVAYWADPHHETPGEINTRDDGRGFYFDDPNGHNLEVLTQPYGSRE